MWYDLCTLIFNKRDMGLKETSYISCPLCWISFDADDFYKDIEMIWLFIESIHQKSSEEDFAIFKKVILEHLEEYD